MLERALCIHLTATLATCAASFSAAVASYIQAVFLFRLYDSAPLSIAFFILIYTLSFFFFFAEILRFLVCINASLKPVYAFPLGTLAVNLLLSYFRWLRFYVRLFPFTLPSEISVNAWKIFYLIDYSITFNPIFFFSFTSNFLKDSLLIFQH